MRIYIPYDVEYIIENLNKHEYEAFIVGGCVRDILLNNIPKDFDITTNAKPDDIIKIFKDCKIICTGIKYGTVTLVKNKSHYEITTYRIESEYEDCRKPKSVKYTSSLVEDLKRRDFTINAICYNSKEGIVDLFEGITDIKNRLIKSVGNPRDRFKEDALRMLRAIRFACILDFDIEENTLKAIHDNAYLIKNISKERIIDELNKIILSNNEIKFEIIINTNILNYIIDEEIILNYNYKIKYFNGNIPLTLTYLFIDDKNDIKKILKKMHYDNDTIDKAILLKQHKDIKIKNDKFSLKIILNKLGYENLSNVLLLKSIIFDTNYEDVKNTIEKIIKNKECFKLKDLNINGDDLINLGIKKGKNIGILLNKLLLEVMKRPCINEKNVLINMVENLNYDSDF